MSHPAHASLDRLTETEDVDGVLELVTLVDVAKAWCAYNSRDANDDADPDWWAVAFFYMAPLWERGRRELLHAALLALLDQADTDLLVGCVGAGPLEVFVSDDDDDLSWLEAQARTNPRLRQALRNVWCAGEVSDKTLARLDHVAGAALKRPSSPRPRP